MPAPSNDHNVHLYLSIGQENRIAIYRMCPKSGRLERAGGVELQGAPGALEPGPGNKVLYAAIRSIKSVTALSIDQSTGLLAPIATTPVFDNPVYLAIDRPGRYLLVSSYSGGKVAVYPIRSDGSVGEKETDLVETRKNPHSINFDPSNMNVFVPNTGADCILQFRWDSERGKLIPNEPPLVETAPKTGPRHFCFHPSKNLVYFVNEKGSSVDAFRLEPSTGRLSHFQSLSTLPANYSGQNACADIHMTPSGQYLYASNRGHDSLAAYKVDEVSGRLKAIGHFSTEACPRAFQMDPAGRFLYSAGENSGRLASYRIASASGVLDPLETYEVGKGPSWIEVLSLGGATA